MLSKISNSRFWIALIGVLVSLSFMGLSISYFITKPLPNYYRTSYLEFALPPLWSCVEVDDGADCVHTDTKKKQKESIILLVAKRRNKSDNIENYVAHLNKKKKLINSKGEKYESKVKYVRKVTIGNYDWVDALHDGSEVHTYFTRYLATNTAQIGVVITFSSHHRSFDKWNKEFEKTIKSLQIYQKESPFNF